MDWDYLLMHNCMTFVNMSWIDCGDEIMTQFRPFFYGYMMCRHWILYIGSWLMFMLLYSVVLANMLKWCDNMQSWLLDSLCLFKQLLELGLLACMDVDYCLRWNSWIIGLCHRSGSYEKIELLCLMKSRTIQIAEIECPRLVINWKSSKLQSKLLSIYLLFVYYF